MIWTTNTPTIPGWYWYRDQQPASLVFVRFGGNVADVMSMRTDGAITQPVQTIGTPKLMGGEWCGPIAPPLEPPQ